MTKDPDKSQKIAVSASAIFATDGATCEITFFLDTGARDFSEKKGSNERNKGS